MNLLKKLTAGILAVALPGIASAATFNPTVVHITGSTAFRASATVGIIAKLGGTSCRVLSYGGSPATVVGKAIFQIFANGTIGASGTATTVVLTQWTGALAGPVDLAVQNTSENFINMNDSTVISDVNSTLALATGTTGGGFTGGVTVASAPAVTPAPPDAAFSDEFQASAAASVATVPSISPAIVANGVSLTNGAALAKVMRTAPFVDAGTTAHTAGTVGIVPFEWILGNYAGYTGSNAPFTNVTQQTAHAMIENGFEPVAFFSNPQSGYTGTPTADWAYFTGRSEDSGTRINNFAEPQDGFGNPPQDFALTFSGTVKTTGAIPPPTTGLQVGGSGAVVTSMDYWPSSAPLNTEPSINWNTTGHGGYVSGGDVANVLSALLPAVVNTSNTVTDGSSVYIPNAPSENTGQPFLVSYVGIADAGGLSGAGVHNGTVLTYNGVAYSPAAVLSGSYSIWGFEHLWYLGSGPSQVGSVQKTFLDTLADSIFSTYAPSDSAGVLNPTSGDGAGILYNPNLGVSKGQEGDIISVNY